MKNKKGFSLIELLAVIAILGLIILIAVPNVLRLYENARKETFVSDTKKVFSEAEKKYVNDAASGNYYSVISSNGTNKLDLSGEKMQYCIVLNDDGSVKNLKVSNGRWIASYSGEKSIKDLTIDDLEEGNLDDYECDEGVDPIPESDAVYCTFNGSMVQGAEYTNGQYTYRYRQEYLRKSQDDSIRDVDMADEMVDYTNAIVSDTKPVEKLKYVSEGWFNITDYGWGVILDDKNSTDPVTSRLCTYINGKPVVSMSYMFSGSAASSIDLSSFNTKNVKNMNNMFSYTSADVLDLSKFVINNSVDMTDMFKKTKATKGFARDNITITYLNDEYITNIPNTLTFTVK